MSQINETRFPRLLEVMERLLGPDGCPWDREQTLTSLRMYVLEEAFEVADAIDHADMKELKQELGDLLLQVVFQSALAKRQGDFDINDVIDAICDKMVRRHPHVFGELKVSGAAEVFDNWEAIKAEERKTDASGKTKGRLDGVPTAMPSLLRAFRLGQKASAAGFDWGTVAGARSNIDKELSELDAALGDHDSEKVIHEIGDVLFSVANLARKLDIDPEAALALTLKRFTDRFSFVEQRLRQEHRDFSELNEEDRDALWAQAKLAYPR